MVHSGGMQVLWIIPWDTVRSREMNPRSISSAKSHRLYTYIEGKLLNSNLASQPQSQLDLNLEMSRGNQVLH